MVRPLSRLGLAALVLAHEFAFRVFPLSPRGKTPLLASGHAYLDATTHPEQVAAWWDVNPNANIGIYPGASDLVVLDFDGPLGHESAIRLGLLDHPTLEVITARGTHRYYRLPTGVVLGNHCPWAGGDVRAHRGYVTAPPSLHPTGFQYEWRGDLDEIADLPVSVLALLTPRPSTLVSTTASLPSSSTPTLNQHPVPSPHETQRLQHYMKAIGEVMPGHRNNVAFDLAAFMYVGLGLAEDTTNRLLRVWNGTLQLPLPEEELRHVLRNAIRYRDRRGRSA